MLGDIPEGPAPVDTASAAAMSSAGSWSLIAAAVARLATAESLDAIARLLRAEAREGLGADGICFIVRDGDEVRYVAEDAIGPLWEGRSFPIDACVSGHAIMTGGTIVTTDITTDDRVPIDLYRETFVKSMAVAPIGGDVRQAAIGAYWSRLGGPNSEAVAKLELLARTAGAALVAIDRLSIHRAGEERLRAALAAGRMGSWEIDIGTRRLTCSDDCRAHHGRFGDASFTYADLLASTHVDDRARMRAAADRSLGEGVDFEIEYRCIWPDGTERLLHVRGVPGLRIDGTVDRLTGVTADVTERRHVEAALRKSEAELTAQTQRFRIAQQAGGVGAFEWYPATGEMAVSDEYRRLWGFGPNDEVSASALVALLHPDDVSAAGPSRIDTFANPLEYAEYRIRRLDTGEERWLARRGETMLTEDGDARRFVGVAFDITDRKRAEAKLRESEERFRLIADSAPVPMWVTKAGGGARLFANDAYCAFLSVDYWDALSFDWRARIHPDDVQRLLVEQQTGEASNVPFALEARYLRADGEWRWLHSESQPRWGPAGEHDGFIGIAYDITAARQAEEALRRINERLEERVATALAEKAQAEAGLRQAQKMEAVGRLTGGIAHDFNNLLTPVMGGLEIIASKVEDERLKRLAGNALVAAQRGAKLTGQLLAFSRIQRLSIVPFDINLMVEAMLELVRGTIGPTIDVQPDLDPDAGAALGDPNQVENALLNLAINARDAMPDGGTLTIRTRRMTLDATADHAAGNFVSLAVRDTGTGMSDDVMARATEPFFTTKPLGQGTGLGLAQVYGVARQSGGTVAIESVAGEGTTVCVLLPVADVAASAEADPEAPSTVRRPSSEAHVLVIDDDDDVRAFLADSIAALGYRVSTADGGGTGLDRVRDDAPDVVLVDYAMVGMTGAEVASTLRRDRPGLPIVIVSGHADSDALRDALGTEMRILKKPFAMDDLANAIADAIEG